MCYINAAAEEQPAETAVPVRVTGSVRESGEEKVPPGPQPAAASVGTADGTQVIAPATDGSTLSARTSVSTPRANFDCNWIGHNGIRKDAHAG
jgi:hypothetical protein